MNELMGEGEIAPRMYEDLGDYATIKPLFEEIMSIYNRKRKPLNLVFFEDALEHLTRIHRTLRLPQVGLELGGAGSGAGPSASGGELDAVHCLDLYRDEPHAPSGAYIGADARPASLAGPQPSRCGTSEPPWR